MHMWMWFGYDLGEFLFPGLTVDTRWAFALTWIALFFVSLLFEASKVYLAKVQREAQKKLLPYRSDERRNLLCEREQGNVMEPTTSRNTGAGAFSRWAAIRLRMSINCHQTAIFLLHNVVGYLLMLAVMLYNVELLIAVLCGMMLGYFLFGTKLTRLQMQCFSTKRIVICTPECDDTAETSTPPLLGGSMSSESDFFICNTRTCIQPSHYLPARHDAGAGAPDTLAAATCYYGAKKCPSKVARLKKIQSVASTSQYNHESERDSPSVEDVQLLRTERKGCCKRKQEPPPDAVSSADTSPGCCSKEEEVKEVSRDVARLKKIQSVASTSQYNHESERDSPSVEDVQLLRTERKGCCKRKQEPPPDAVSSADTSPGCCSKEEEVKEVSRDVSPQITCCRTSKSVGSESQEKIVS